ncbi:MAG: hypothetical protein M3442_03870 [Chloroflexota bacterium]|nr:hypothetical protein [Chloroflexota bacterium]
MSGVTVREVDLRVLNMHTRLPFRYGIATLTVVPHLLLRLHVDVDGTTQIGQAAEGLPPKWFTKDPQTSFRQEVEDMLRVVRHAGDVALAAGGAATPFDLWWSVYRTHSAWAASLGLPPLLAGLGPSLVERALIDAFCRAQGLTFPTAVRRNAFGARLGDLHPELDRLAPAELLPATPLRAVAIRHTVGLADHLRDGDIPPAERVDDGLPQSLAACVQAYGLTHFKVKLYGDVARDRARLREVAAVLSEHAGGRYAFSLDGNEQYHAVAEFRALWEALAAEATLAPFMGHILFVEQPLHRDVALSPAAGTDLRAWTSRPPIIIDESDGAIESLPLALEQGYAGASHKNCKGVFRSLANACLLEWRRRREPQRSFVLSAEDLANVGPVALLQDLAAVATLGIDHVERNGHHYFPGLSMFPPDVQQAVLRDHGDLYVRSPHPPSPVWEPSVPLAQPLPVPFPTLAITQGQVRLDSVVDAPFGARSLVDPAAFVPLDDWRFESLGLAE